MGFGDEIMATYYAKVEKQKYPDRQVVVGNYKKRKARCNSSNNGWSNCS